MRQLQTSMTRFLLLLSLLAGTWAIFPLLAWADALDEIPQLAEPTQTATLRIDGSSDMQVINQLLKQRYEEEYPDISVDVDKNGTETAIQELIEGDIDLAAIGRRLTDSEKAKGLVEIPLSQERIAVIVGKNNPFKGNLTVEQFIQILRGEITDWSEVGGPEGAIRVIDRPLESDTRIALSRYGIFQPDGLVTGESVIRLETDDTAAVIKALGRDGISYAIAGQLVNQDFVRFVKLVVMHEALPDDPLYPYSQVRGYAYKKKPNSTAAAFVDFANAPTGQAVVGTAKLEEAKAIATALKPKPAIKLPEITAVPPADDAYLPRGKGGVFYWFGLLLLPLVLLGVLLQGILRFLNRRSSESVEPAQSITTRAITTEAPAEVVASEPAATPEVITASIVNETPALEAAPEPEPVPEAEPAAPTVAEVTSTVTPAIALPTIFKLYEEGVKLMVTGRYAEALPYLNQAVEEKPDYYEAWLAQGKTLLALGRSPEALASFERVLAIAPDTLDALQGRGEALVKLGRTDEATVSYARLAELAPERAVRVEAEPAPVEAAVEAVTEPLIEPVTETAEFEAPEAIAESVVEVAEPAPQIAPDVDTTTAPAIAEVAATSGDAWEPLIIDYLASRGKTPAEATDTDAYLALATLIHNHLGQSITQLPTMALETSDRRIIGYLSAEYLPGPHLENALIALGVYDRAATVSQNLGFDLRRLIEVEEEPGLGRGDLGRLGICYLDSMATLGVPAIAYGIRYERGIFDQEIQDGWQVEAEDRWLQYGNPWEIERPESTVEIGFGGRTEAYIDDQRRFRMRWVPAEVIRGIPYDTLIPGYHNHSANVMRLWRAEGADYLSNVLYPSDMEQWGKELRLKQQFFFTACSVQDVVRSHLSRGGTVENLPERFTLQLNDTDSIIAIAELMRLLMDEYALEWDAAWELTQRTCAYTNHSLLPEALDQYYYSLPLLNSLLPRHHEIILGINCRFLNGIREANPGDDALASRLSLIDESNEKFVRMVHLGCVGSHAVNGVSQLHTDLLKHSLVPDYYQLFPEKFSHQTNGVSPRRFLLVSNPRLAALITSKIGDSWVTNLDELRRLGAFIDNADFRQEWWQIKQAAKRDLASLIEQQLGLTVNPEALFDLQVMDMHEYKRQHLNALHILTLYNQIKANPNLDMPPRVFIFAGKAAPDYSMAKLMIKLIHAIAGLVNHDPDMAGRLQVAFLPDLTVKLAQKLYPAADVSEHLSLAGTEACGTGSLMFGMNGAVLLATPDGVVPEVRNEIGAENMFSFGLTTTAASELRANGYKPWSVYDAIPELKEVVDRLNAGDYSLGNGSLFKPLTDELLAHDPYMVLADYQAYSLCQAQVGQAFRDREGWLRRSINTTARIGRFSSDRAIYGYCQDIWQIEPNLTAQQEYAQA